MSNQSTPAPEQFVTLQVTAELLRVPIKSVLHVKGVAKLQYQTESGERVWKLADIRAIAKEREAQRVAARNPLPQGAVVLSTLAAESAVSAS